MQGTHEMPLKAYTGSLIIALVAIHGAGIIMMYLMMVVHFSHWLDAARISCFLALQFGGTLAFAVFRNTLPCENLGSQMACDIGGLSIIYGGWAFSGWLLFYLFCLVTMTYIPKPVPRDPEEKLYDRSGSIEDSHEKSPEPPSSSKSWDFRDSTYPIPVLTSESLGAGQGGSPRSPYAYSGSNRYQKQVQYTSENGGTTSPISRPSAQMYGRMGITGQSSPKLPMPFHQPQRPDPILLQSGPSIGPQPYQPNTVSPERLPQYGYGLGNRQLPERPRILTTLPRQDELQSPYLDSNKFTTGGHRRNLTVPPGTPIALIPGARRLPSPGSVPGLHGAPSIRSMTASLYLATSPVAAIPTTLVSPNRLDVRGARDSRPLDRYSILQRRLSS
ncbi:hypothetical protein AX16_003590 [Volvariella volvacea WC 439]|nr:hypothetical protein AX16_003590 [Volvariella volvacea WC 439]